MSTIFLVRHRVRQGMEPQYEAWLRRIMPIAAGFPGHQGVHVIRPATHHDEYLIVLRFASEDLARAWTESEARQTLLKEVERIIDQDRTELQNGIEFWFSPPGERKPAGWKQWLVTTSVIAPLTMIIPPLLQPAFDAVPFLGSFMMSHIIVAAVIVAIVTFIVMPRYVHLLRRWLYDQRF